MPYAQCPLCNSTFHLNVSDPEQWYKDRYPKYDFNALIPEFCLPCWRKSSNQWQPFDDGQTIGTTGSESGTIVSDEEHPTGARMTLEKDTSIAPFAITCGIYGWMFHTVFLGKEPTATTTFEEMKENLNTILALVPSEENFSEKQADKVNLAISNFVERFQ